MLQNIAFTKCLWMTDEDCFGNIEDWYGHAKNKMERCMQNESVTCYKIFKNDLKTNSISITFRLYIGILLRNVFFYTIYFS